MVRALRIKLEISSIIVVLAVASLPLIGLTSSAEDDARGVVIDFGYWDVVWTEMVFQEDWDAVDALEKACEMNGFSVVFGDAGKTSIVSINGQLNLYGVTWGLYVLDGGGWRQVEDYHSVNASDAGIVCWARAGGAEDVIPGVDQSGFNYYSYARDGFSLRTGERIRHYGECGGVGPSAHVKDGIVFI